MGYAAGRNPTPAQLKKLLRIFSEDLRKNPGDLLLRLKLAEVLRLLGRFEEAVSLYGSVAWSYAVAGNLVQAIMLCKLILELKPDHQETQQMLAKLYASKRIREEKQSVPVVNVDGRWVADPRDAEDGERRPGASSGRVSSSALGTASSPAASSPAASSPELRTSSDALARPPSMSGVAADLAAQAAKARAEARREAAERSRAALSGSHSAQQVTEIESNAGAALPAPPGATGPQPGPAPDGPTGPMRPLATSPTAVGKPTPKPPKPPKPLARVETSDDFEPHLSSSPNLTPPNLTPMTSEQLPAPPPVQSDLPVTYVGKSPLTEAPPADQLDAGSRLEQAEQAEQAEKPEHRKRETMRLQTVSSAGEAAPMALLPGQPPAALHPQTTGPVLRRGRSLRVELSQGVPSATPRPTRGYLPPRAAEGASFLPPTASPQSEPAAPPPQESSEDALQQSGSFGDEHFRPTELHDPVAADKPLESAAQQTDRDGPAPLDELAESAPAPDTIEDTAVSDPPVAEMLEPDGDAVEQLDRPARRPKATAPMDTAVISTLLRKDAELAYREAKSTDGYAAIQREVLVRGQEQADIALADSDEQEAERKLEQTLQELPSHASQELPSDASLPEIPLFSDLGKDAFIALVERLEARIYDAGEFVIHEGEPGDSLLLVSAGRLQVLKGDPGAYVELALLGPGSFFGEFGLLTDQRRHASVRCMDDTEVLELRRDVLADLIRDHPTVQNTLRTFYQRRVLQMVLATSPLFRAVSPGERDALIPSFATRRYVEDEVIVTEGEHAGAFYVILVGDVAVTCQDEDGAEVQVGALSEGQYFGEMSLISGYPAEATVRATRVTEVLALDELAFYEMASAHPEIWAEVQRESQARAEANDRILAERRAGALLL